MNVSYKDETESGFGNRIDAIVEKDRPARESHPNIREPLDWLGSEDADLVRTAVTNLSELYKSGCQYVFEASTSFEIIQVLKESSALSTCPADLFCLLKLALKTNAATGNHIVSTGLLGDVFEMCMNPDENPERPDIIVQGMKLVASAAKLGIEAKEALVTNGVIEVLQSLLDNLYSFEFDLKDHANIFDAVVKCVMSLMQPLYEVEPGILYDLCLQFPRIVDSGTGPNLLTYVKSLLKFIRELARSDFIDNDWMIDLFHDESVSIFNAVDFHMNSEDETTRSLAFEAACAISGRSSDFFAVWVISETRFYDLLEELVVCEREEEEEDRQDDDAKKWLNNDDVKKWASIILRNIATCVNPADEGGMTDEEYDTLFSDSSLSFVMDIMNRGSMECKREISFALCYMWKRVPELCFKIFIENEELLDNIAESMSLTKDSRLADWLVCVLLYVNRKAEEISKECGHKNAVAMRLIQVLDDDCYDTLTSTHEDEELLEKIESLFTEVKDAVEYDTQKEGEEVSFF